MRFARLTGIILFVIFLFVGVGFLFFSCIHYQNYWALFVVVPCVVAFIAPAICYGYDQEDLAFKHIEMDEQSFRTCRELGWAVAIILFLATYGVPVLAWWNAAFAWQGCVLVHATLTVWCFGYILWLRIFVFVRRGN